VPIVGQKLEIRNSKSETSTKSEIEKTQNPKQIQDIKTENSEDQKTEEILAVIGFVLVI
jgi:hypothetical protein